LECGKVEREKEKVHSEHNMYEWLADTGTTSHITHWCDAFATYELIPKIRVSGVEGVQSLQLQEELYSYKQSVMVL